MLRNATSQFALCTACAFNFRLNHNYFLEKIDNLKKKNIFAHESGFFIRFFILCYHFVDVRNICIFNLISIVTHFPSCNVINLVWKRSCQIDNTSIAAKFWKSMSIKLSESIECHPMYLYLYAHCIYVIHGVRLTAPAQSLTQSSPAALIADQRRIAVFGNQAAWVPFL